MAIKIKSKCVVGFRFSDICAYHDSSSGVYYTYLTEVLREEVSKKFEGGKIDDFEVNPELLSIVFDLDCFEYKNDTIDDAIIGVELTSTDAGEKNVGLTNVYNVETAKSKVIAHIEEIDSEIAEKVRVEIGIVTQIREINVK